ncbi:aldo/keto reductase [Microbacterium sp. SORGH_AS_0862]|uniref:aldo/keto reductase n=1 Tax=Microbacterium sp. SORGH_AS_0862 TaxID=3041789 RepID=UPI0027932C92|nr:aldo/keto reductase [Microbacterium sp. SORGH_AS_0862]MDQ1203865.1 aryl-alcohol dehydrogenase-like predicted oxidoreductase [Microbacterium sp. SORGH_AS_0862]
MTSDDTSSKTPEDRTMKQIGASGIFVPAMGNGTQAWGDKRFGYGTSYTRDNLYAIYKMCLDAGLNFFDTSDTYGKGLAEELLGEFHRKDGRPVTIATKFTQAKLYDPNRNLSVRAVKTVLESSLKRLQVDTVDLYQVHYPPARRALDRYLDAMADTVKSGKAKAVGVSNFSTDYLRYSYSYLWSVHGVRLASSQVGFNLLHRHPETNGMLDACRELGVTILPILPLAEGVLTGKYRAGGQEYGSQAATLFRGASLFEPGESFFKAMRSKPYEMHREELEPLFDVMDAIARAHEGTIAQVALNWLIASDPLVIPIPGAKSPSQVTSNAAALGWTMSATEFRRLSQTEAEIRRAIGY